MAISFQTLIILLLLVALGIGVVAADADDEGEGCGFNSTCINHEVCRDDKCICPSSKYGEHCQYAVLNAVIITIICVFPPFTWLLLCCWSVHRKLYAKQPIYDMRSSEPEHEAVEEIIDDHPPPTYAQVLTFDVTGSYEVVELDAGASTSAGTSGDTPGPRVTVEIEPPPSYEEWVLKAARLTEQEVSASVEEERSIMAISDNMGAGERPTVEVQLAQPSDLQPISSL